MFSEAGMEAVLQFGALGLLGAFMYLLFQSYKSQTEFQQRMMIRIITVIEENTTSQKQETVKSEAVCTLIETNRTMEKEEHEALMTQHGLLMEGHKHITEKLAV